MTSSEKSWVTFPVSTTFPKSDPVALGSGSEMVVEKVTVRPPSGRDPVRMVVTVRPRGLPTTSSPPWFHAAEAPKPASPVRVSSGLVKERALARNSFTVAVVVLPTARGIAGVSGMAKESILKLARRLEPPSGHALVARSGPPTRARKKLGAPPWQATGKVGGSEGVAVCCTGTLTAAVDSHTA